MYPKFSKLGKPNPLRKRLLIFQYKEYVSNLVNQTLLDSKSLFHLVNHALLACVNATSKNNDIIKTVFSE